MSMQQVFKAPQKKDKSLRRWKVHYDLAYDGGSGEFECYYRTYVGARVARFWNLYIGSWGGTATLHEQP